jgi:hypothetical protein
MGSHRTGAVKKFALESRAYVIGLVGLAAGTAMSVHAAVTYLLSVAAMIATWPVTLATSAIVAVGFFAIGTGAPACVQSKFEGMLMSRRSWTPLEKFGAAALVGLLGAQVLSFVYGWDTYLPGLIATGLMFFVLDDRLSVRGETRSRKASSDEGRRGPHADGPSGPSA